MIFEQRHECKELTMQMYERKVYQVEAKANTEDLRKEKHGVFKTHQGQLMSWRKVMRGESEWMVSSQKEEEEGSGR